MTLDEQIEFVEAKIRIWKTDTKTHQFQLNGYKAVLESLKKLKNHTTK